MATADLQLRHACMNAARMRAETRDLAHVVPSARSLDTMRLRRSPRGLLRGKAIGRGMRVDMPKAGTLEVTVGFVDPGNGSTSGRCSVMTAPLHEVRKGVRAP
jgi:hypothetical protein